MKPDEPDMFISERARHEANVAADAAFCAAMMRAIARGKVKVQPGTYVDDSPLVPARIYDFAPRAGCYGSPAAMCAESSAVERQ